MSIICSISSRLSGTSACGTNSVVLGRRVLAGLVCAGFVCILHAGASKFSAGLCIIQVESRNQVETRNYQCQCQAGCS